MDNRQQNSRNGACNNYRWDAGSFGRKLGSDVSINVGPVSKQISGPNDSNKDAYRNCQNCSKHFNYHSNSDNSYKNGQINIFKK